MDSYLYQKHPYCECETKAGDGYELSDAFGDVMTMLHGEVLRTPLR